MNKNSGLNEEITSRTNDSQYGNIELIANP
jgi:hypothetical protein